VDTLVAVDRHTGELLLVAADAAVHLTFHQGPDLQSVAELVTVVKGG
jgi:hypothetical protein